MILGLCVLGMVWAQAALPPHPRLLFPAEQEARVKERVTTDPLAALLRDAVMVRAEAILKERTCEHRIPDGKRLLQESRMALNHILHTGMAWRLSGEERFRERCLREMEAAAALRDWNPSHFLDTAEMAAALAIGYDWLHASLSAEEAARFREALVEKALKPGREIFRKGGGWTRAGNNWGQVCATGLSLAAVALAGAEPEWLESILAPSREVMRKSLRFYEPDGLYPEGPGYWDYGSNYHVLFHAMQEGLGETPDRSAGWDAAGDFMAHAAGPFGLAFNFADSGTGQSEPSAARSWLATRHPRPEWRGAHVRGLLLGREGVLRREGSKDRFFPLHLLWLPEDGAETAKPPLAARFRGEQAMAAFRSAWGDRDAMYLAVKGGSPAVSHGQMDVGSFVLDALGQRWAHDLGTDDYNLPGYFGERRWDYFRLQNRSHNTLVIDGGLQDPKSKPCPLVETAILDEGGKMHASFDLSAAYRGQAAKVVRRVDFDPSGPAAEMTDTVREPIGPVRWGMMTAADIAVEDGQALLSQKGRRLRIECLEPAGAVWQVLSAEPPSAVERRNEGFQLLTLTVKPGDGDMRIRVRFVPLGAETRR